MENHNKRTHKKRLDIIETKTTKKKTTNERNERRSIIIVRFCRRESVFTFAFRVVRAFAELIFSRSSTDDDASPLRFKEEEGKEVGFLFRNDDDDDESVDDDEVDQRRERRSRKNEEEYLE